MHFITLVAFVTLVDFPRELLRFPSQTRASQPSQPSQPRLVATMAGRPTGADRLMAPRVEGSVARSEWSPVAPRGGPGDGESAIKQFLGKSSGTQGSSTKGFKELSLRMTVGRHRVLGSPWK